MTAANPVACEHSAETFCMPPALQDSRLWQRTSRQLCAIAIEERSKTRQSHRIPMPFWKMNAAHRRSIGIFTVVSAAALLTRTRPFAVIRRAGPARFCEDDVIVIVGAGVAGLGAAHVLSLLNCHVTVLDARPRIGGRMHTIGSGAFEGQEDGARWIHGGTENLVLRRLFDALGLSMYSTPGDETYQSGMSSLLMKLSNGSSVPAAQVLSSREAYERVDEAMERFDERRRERGEPDMTVGAVYDKVAPTAMRSGRLTDRLRRLLAFHFRQNVEGNFGADARGPTGLSLDDTYGNAPYTDFYKVDKRGRNSNTDTVPVGGFASLVDALCASMRRSARTQILLGADGEVVSIQYAINVDPTNTSVVLQTRSGRVFHASVAFVTIPLAVMQRHPPHFKPPLNAFKQQALRSLAMGALDAVMLRWPIAAQFWPANVSGFGYLPEPGSTLNGYTLALNAQAIGPPISAPILTFYLGGVAARKLEEKSDAEVSREAHAVLEHMFGHTVPTPTHVRVTRWVSDRFAGGSYTYVPVGGDAAAALVLASPIANGRLRFAGEATCHRMYATVHGAYVSAMREVAAYVSLRDRSSGAAGFEQLTAARWRWPLLSLADLCEQALGPSHAH